MDPITIALGLAQFAPMIAGYLGGSKASAVASHVVGIAQAVTGTQTPDAALSAIQNDGELATKFQAQVVESKVQIDQIAADEDKAIIDAQQKNAADVNATMQVEDKADHWPTYSWRPFIGFCFGLGMLGGVLAILVAYGCVMFGGRKADALQYLPGMLGALAAMLATASPILGIASYFRGRMQADPTIPSDNRG
jgi:hypothetical protein